MKFSILALFIVAPVLLGLATGGGAAWLNFSDPGPDMEWVRRVHSTSLVANPSRPESPPQNALEIVGGNEFDFGVMDRGEKREHTFILRNHSAEEITLEKGDTTCKCTAFELASLRLPPGGETEILLEWEAKSMETDFRQTATIRTSSKYRPQLMLSVFGKVLQLVQAFPSDISFSDVTSRDERVATFTLLGYKEPTLEIVKQEWQEPSTADFFELKAEPISQEKLDADPDAQAGLDCTVRMKAGLPLGIVYQGLKLTTSAARSGVLEIPIRARIVGDISLSGSGYNESTNQITISPVRQNLGTSKKLFLIIKGEFQEAFEVKEVRMEPADVFQVHMGEPKSLKSNAIKMIPIEIEIPPGAKPVNYSGGDEHPVAKLTFVTTHPESKEILVGLRFAVIE